MLRRFCGMLLFANVIALALASGASALYAAPKNEADWKVLTDQPSRQQLFADVVLAALHDNPGLDSQGSLAIPPSFSFPDDANTDHLDNDRNRNVGKEVVFGIDLSHHNAGPFDFRLVPNQAIGFVFLKATQGGGFKDGAFAARWAQLSAFGTNLRRGAYHFISSGVPGKDQADAFVNYVNLHGGWQPGDLAPVVDLEWDRTSDNPDNWAGRSPEYILGVVVPLLQRIEALTKRKPVIYTARSWFTNKTVPLSQIAPLAGYPIWVADYNPKRKLAEKPNVLPNTNTVLWQFTDGALAANAAHGKMDASIFYGSTDALLAAFGAK